MKTKIGWRKNNSRFKTTAWAVFTFWLATNWVPGQGTNGIPTLARLRDKIAAHLAQPRFSGALWGVKIVSLDTGKTLFESHADRLLSPASNCKMFTGALAFDRFGGDYRISTPIYATAKPNRSGTIRGDVIIVGHGDPTWNARRFGTNFWDIFEPFVSALTNAGVRRVTGDLIADATFFHGEPTGSSLTVDDFQNGECPYISALTINDGLAQVRVTPGADVGAPCRLTRLQPDADRVFSNSAVTVSSNGAQHIEYYMPFGGKMIYVFGQLPLGDGSERLDIPDLEPARWFGVALKDALARHGIKISGRVRSISWPQNFVVDTNRTVKLGEVLSPPLREIVRLYLKPSQNLENDTVLAHVGETTRTSETPPWRTSEELGLAALHQFLVTNGLPANEVLFDEGSGLSNNNLATANSMVALLQFVATNRWARDFENALPIAGEDGTLRRRMTNAPAAGNVHAKTGTLHWANALSGCVTTAAGEKLAFSLMLNRYDPPPDRKRTDELDDIAVMLAGFTGRSDE
jgi:serine-type D-Ala-D-Ala carboxypeptidase/endopeptidase (penicillin-binding protein 4)